MTNMFKPAKNEVQKAKLLFGGIVVSFLMIAYQNCSKQSSHGNGYVDRATEQKPAVLELKNSSSLILIDKDTIRDFGSYAYEIDVHTGIVERTMFEVPKEDPANKPVQLCLSEDKRIALESAYNAASVCLFKTKSENMVCTQEYISPYAVVTQSLAGIRPTPDRTYKLGENAKPCNDYYDLCIDNRGAFIAAAKSALDGLDESLCE